MPVQQGNSVLAAQVFLGLAFALGLAAGYAIVAWQVGRRWTDQGLFFLWLGASVLLGTYLTWGLANAAEAAGPGLQLPFTMFVSTASSPALGFGLATVSVRRHLRRTPAPDRLSWRLVVRGTGAFLLGLVLAVVPQLVSDIVALFR